MNTLHKVRPNELLCGDRILIKDHTWIITNIIGPDHIGTFDLYLKDDYGNQKMVLVTEPVTILM